ncbi:unnamed protein product [Cylicocyclus nassatus]|uniref:Uncharacterized protein n=1 Tax=Cylicocyclus nassatus TaxID=53992 RepID=A0AA36GLE1_CYLNA|nr:unnamed protein product [Cylicocyclus nassatus]
MTDNSKMSRCLLIQLAVMAVCTAYPQLFDTEYDESALTRQLAKRAFDRLDGNEFGLFKRSVNKRAFDRLDMADFGFRRKRGFDRIARAEFGLTGLRRKRSFDRLFPDEYGLREKRALDRLDSSEFGLIKRSVDSYPDRERLIDDLADSIVLLRNGLKSQGATSDVLEVPVTTDESQ